MLRFADTFQRPEHAVAIIGARRGVTQRAVCGGECVHIDGLFFEHGIEKRCAVDRALAFERLQAADLASGFEIIAVGFFQRVALTSAEIRRRQSTEADRRCERKGHAGIRPGFEHTEAERTAQASAFDHESCFHASSSSCQPLQTSTHSTAREDSASSSGVSGTMLAGLPQAG